MASGYERGRVIGKGSFGTAILARRISTGEHVVIKELKLSGLPEAEQVAARRESSLLQTLSHPGIIVHHETYEDADAGTLCIVTSFCERGDLSQLMATRRGVPLTEEELLSFFVQISLAMLYLHRRKILHRDLKVRSPCAGGGGSLSVCQGRFLHVLPHREGWRVGFYVRTRPPPSPTSARAQLANVFVSADMTVRGARRKRGVAA